MTLSRLQRKLSAVELTYRLLLSQLQGAAGGYKPKVTVVLGAGCSLSSSNDESVASTSGLVASLVQDWTLSSVNEIPEQDRWTLFHRLWIKQGTEQRRLEIARRLQGLRPASGYRHLAALIERGCIGSIITTNFDLMLDQVLEVIPHRRFVGSHGFVEVGAPASAIELIKVHGDIRDGGVLFEPRELHSLPESLAEKIHNATKAPVLVVGYRGQDNGFMTSLNNDTAFNAFWANPRGMAPDDEYLNAPIFDWMNRRNSWSNFLVGDFGDFDKLFERLHADLDVGSVETIGHEQSADNPVLDLLHHSSRLVALHNQIIEALTDIVQQDNSAHVNPFGAPSAQSALQRFVDVLAVRHLSPRFHRALNNELDALALLISTMIYAFHGDDVRASERLIRAVEERLTGGTGPARIDASIWALVSSICGYTPSTGEAVTLKIHFNHRTALTLISECKDPAELRGAFRYLCHLSVLAQGEMSDYLAKTELGRHLQAIRAKVISSELYGDRTILRLDPLTKDELSCLRSLLDDISLSDQPEDSIEIVLATEWLQIVTREIGAAKSKPAALKASSFVDALLSGSYRSTMEFLALHDPYGISPERVVQLPLDDILQEFVATPYSGLLIVGPSGTGKTTALKRFASSNSAQARHTLVRTPKLNAKTTSAAELFFSLGSQDEAKLGEVMRVVNETLAARRETLVLLLDGLNEFSSDIDDLILLYRDIIRLAGDVARHKLERIKIVVSVRSHLYWSLKQAVGVPPSEAFYTPGSQLSGHEPETGIADIKPLNLSDICKLAAVYFTPAVLPLFIDLISTHHQLAQQYSHPFLLAVAGKVAPTPELVDRLHSSGTLFARFADQMLERIGSVHRQNDALTVIHSYFDQLISQDRGTGVVTEFSLSRGYGKAAGELIRVIEDAHIFQRNQVGLISFAHDRIAEHFLGHYLFDRLGNAVTIARAFQLCEANPVFYGGIRSLVWRLLHATNGVQGSEGVAILLHNLLNEHHLPHGSLTTELLVEAAVETDPSAGSLYHILRSAPDRQHFESALGQALWRCADRVPASLLTAHVEPMLQKIRPDSSLFVGSHMALALAGLTNYIGSASLQEAKSRLTKVSGVIGSFAVPIWRDRYRMIEARIARDQGHISESIVLLRELYESQLSQSAWVHAATTALELGRALRDNTRFDEALTVYRRFIEYMSDLPHDLAARLALQMATVEKNLTQEALKASGALSALVRSHHDAALAHLERARHLARQSAILALEIEIAVETVEVVLVLAELDPNSVSIAKEAASEAERLLSFAPLHKQAVPFRRQLAKIEEHTGHLELAVEMLQNARVFAERIGFEFYATDCSYQLGQMISRQPVLRERDDMRLVGVQALEAAIAFYDAKCAPDIVYKRDCQRALESLLTS